MQQILGKSAPVEHLKILIQKVADNKTSILIIGESGTGKELVARAIHEQGPLKDKPFVPVNCGAIPENLIESELFGHRRGSFTGAVSDKDGLFKVADGGTLFLDEVGELPLGMQVKLLRALQDRSIRPVGGNDDIRIDVRIIAATNRDLETAVATGGFREDLYYRLNVILINTPPLRERKDDIPLLANHFLEKYKTKYQSKANRLSQEAMAALLQYSWPGNIRELENSIERALTLETGPEVSVQALPESLRGEKALQGQPSTDVFSNIDASTYSHQGLFVPEPDFSNGPVDLDQILGKIEKTYLEAALQHTGGVKKKAASLLGITFRSIRYRLEKLGLDSSEE